MPKSTTPAPAADAPEFVADQEATDAVLDAIVTEGEAELEAEPEGTPEDSEETPEPEVELSPVQLRNKLRAQLVQAVHDAGVLGLSVLENRDKQQTLHAEAVKLRDAGKVARDAHKVARDEVARIRGLLKD